MIPLLISEMITRGERLQYAIPKSCWSKWQVSEEWCVPLFPCGFKLV